jgi:hypothetical protein
MGVSPVPEPTTLAAGAVLLVPFAISSIRFLRRRSPAGLIGSTPAVPRSGADRQSW